MSHTLKLLIIEFDFRTMVQLKEIAERYYGHDQLTMLKWAADRKYPFVCRRLGGQKSPYMGQLGDLAKALDDEKDLRKNFSVAKTASNQ